VLVLGAGVTGIEAARVLAEQGHSVEVWERAARPGGQIHLAIAAPDKREVEPAWSYRWQAVQALGVPVRTGVTATVETLRAFAPDFVVVATGAAPRPVPFDVQALDPAVRMIQSWDYLLQPDLVPAGAAVTVIGGGMVGVESADLLTVRGAKVAIIEASAAMAAGMARNNRMELVERVAARGVPFHPGTQVLRAEGSSLRVRHADGSEATLPIGDVLMLATGPLPVRDAVALVEEAGIEYALAGDASRPGDFLTCIRDAWMIALSVETRFNAKGSTGVRA
jgi:pyruvate/2-oxoglutarate dehydrogenase complex dihydrolipoamide dehydrogenase (E3) component